MTSPSLILYPFSDLSAFDDRTAAKLIYDLLQNHIDSIAVGLAPNRLDDPAYARVVESFIKTASSHGISVNGVILQERTGDLYNYMRDHAFDHSAASTTWKSWLSSHLVTKEVSNLAALGGADGLDGLLINNEALGAFRSYINGTTLSQTAKDQAIANSVAIYRDYVVGVAANLETVLPAAAIDAINPQLLDDRAGNGSGSNYWAAGATQAYLAATDGVTIDVRISSLAQWDYRSDSLSTLANALLDRVLWYGTKDGVANNFGPLLDSYMSGLKKPVTIEISERVYDTIQPGFSGLDGSQLQQLENLVAQGIVERIRDLEQNVPGLNSGSIDEGFVRDHIFAGIAMVVPGSDGGSSLDRFFQLFPVVNQPPVATNDKASALAGYMTAIDALANDHDSDGLALRVESVTTPRYGKAWIDTDTGKIIYQSTAGIAATDSFTYGVSDGVSISYAKVTVDVRPPVLVLGVRGGADAATIAGKKVAIAAASTELNTGILVIDATGGMLKSTSTEGFGVSGPGDTAVLSRKIDGDESLLFQIHPDYASIDHAVGAKVLLRGVDRNDVVSITGYFDANGDGVLSDDEAVGNYFYSGASDQTAIDTGRATLDVSFLGDTGPVEFDGLSISAGGRNSAVSVFGVDLYGAPVLARVDTPATLTTPSSVTMTVSSSAVIIDGARLTGVDGNASLSAARLKIDAVGGTFKLSADLGVQSGANAADRWGDPNALAKQVNGDEALRFTLTGAQTHDAVQAKVGLSWIGSNDVLVVRAFDDIGGVRTLVGEMRLDAELDPTLARQDVRIGFQDAAHTPVHFSSLELSGVGLGSAFAVHDITFYLS